MGRRILPRVNRRPLRRQPTPPYTRKDFTLTRQRRRSRSSATRAPAATRNTLARSPTLRRLEADTVEIDVNTSSDGVMYLFHGPELERTTDGVGHILYAASVIDRLDAGARFGAHFAGARIRAWSRSWTGSGAEYSLFPWT